MVHGPHLNAFQSQAFNLKFISNFLSLLLDSQKKADITIFTHILQNKLIEISVTYLQYRSFILKCPLSCS